MEYRFISSSAQKTKELGARFGEMLPAGSLITLTGELGAGKTTFTQGLAKGLGIKGKVTSPTFNLMKVYKDGRLPLYHIDAYRMEGILQDLGFDEYVEDDGICVIEWADFMSYILPEDRIEICLEINDDDTRSIIVKSEGARYSEVIEKICTL